MSYAYIAVVIVAVVLIGFVMLSIFWVARSVGNSIRGKTLDIISQYDGLIEVQSQELNRLQTLGRQEELQTPKEQAVPVVSKVSQSSVAPMFVMNTAERISTTEYKDKTAGKLYNQVRTAFTIPPEEIFVQLPGGGIGGEGGPATRLLEELTFDTVFDLSTLEPQTQLALLEEVVPDDAQDLLHAYHQSVRQFNSLDFYCHVQALSQLEPRPTLIRVPKGQKIEQHPANSIVVEDEEICEGMEIEVGNILYDYCIKAREIG